MIELRENVREKHRQYIDSGVITFSAEVIGFTGRIIIILDGHSRYIRMVPGP